MSQLDPRFTGAKAVATLDITPEPGRAAIRLLRMACESPLSRAAAFEDLALALGPLGADAAMTRFDALLDLMLRHGRRALMRHGTSCSCVGSDEAVFAHFVTTAARGEREDAVLIATLLVRADVALPLADLARDLGLSLMRAAGTAPKRPGNHPEAAATRH